ncbi:lipoprotein [Cystobacter fuscus]|uniref:Lipoprotein n=1 Tax=Cystobacter fuscus TaxID=43 RepID=A0A250JEC7_9BACT|nr:lipoprotein [Cystobacter fuscus]
MMRRWVAGLLLSLVVLTGCGVGSAPVRASLGARQALTSSPELLEFESPSIRLELYREVARLSQLEAGQAAQSSMLFPITLNGELVAAPGIEGRTDLLQAPDAGAPLQLNFDGRTGERWQEDRRESFQGLSEREAAELVARTLLAHWKVNPTGVVQVDRASSAPYAAAYVDGILRINPAFLYMAAAYGPASLPGTVQ